MSHGKAVLSRVTSAAVEALNVTRDSKAACMWCCGVTLTAMAMFPCPMAQTCRARLNHAMREGAAVLYAPPPSHDVRGLIYLWVHIRASVEG